MTHSPAPPGEVFLRHGPQRASSLLPTGERFPAPPARARLEQVLSIPGKPAEAAFQVDHEGNQR